VSENRASPSQIMHEPCTRPKAEGEAQIMAGVEERVRDRARKKRLAEMIGFGSAVYLKKIY